MQLNFTQIKETCLYVTDLEATENFYHGKLGLSVISRVEGSHIFFRAGTSVLLCFIAEATKKKKTLPPNFAQGQQHFAFECRTEDYEDWKQRLIEKDIEIEHEEQWPDGSMSVYFRDPDQHLAEIIQPGLWK